MDYDCCVIGGGAIGVLCALMLGRYDLKVALVVGKGTEQSFKRALGLTYGSIRRCQQLGAALNVKHPIMFVDIFSQDRMITSLNSHDHHVPYLGANIYLSELIESLINALPDSVTVIHDEAVSLEKRSHWWVKTLNGTELRSQWIIGADGINSLVRTASESKFLYYEQSAQSALLFEVGVEHKSARDRAYQYSKNDFLYGLIPIDEDRYTLAMTGGSTKIDELLTLSSAQINSFITSNSPKNFDNITIIDRCQKPFSLFSYAVANQSFNQGLLLGLAAKSFHPAAALGFNQSVYEIAVLDQLLGRYGIKKLQDALVHFETAIQPRSNQIKVLTQTLSSKWSRELINNMMIPFKKITSELCLLIS